MIRAGIDIGTNTILLLIAEVQDGHIMRVVEDHVRLVRLGQGVDKNRIFQPDAMERATKCFADYAEILKKYPGIEVDAVATSGSRDAKNAGEFFRQIRAKFDIPIRVVSGAEEAKLSFRGALPEGADPEGLAVLDIGGGSTEVVGQENGVLFRVSFDIGCVRMTERFLANDPPLASEVEALEKYVRDQIQTEVALIKKIKARRFIGVAGTPTYICSAALGLTRFEPERIHGSILTLAGLRRLKQEWLKTNSKQRLGVGGMDQGRADVIVAGALILEAVLELAGVDQIEVSVRGLRYGIVSFDDLASPVTH